jgi:hypothetical protein
MRQAYLGHPLRMMGPSTERDATYGVGGCF